MGLAVRRMQNKKRIDKLFEAFKIANVVINSISFNITTNSSIHTALIVPLANDLVKFINVVLIVLVP